MRWLAPTSTATGPKRGALGSQPWTRGPGGGVFGRRPVSRVSPLPWQGRVWGWLGRIVPIATSSGVALGDHRRLRRAATAALGHQQTFRSHGEKVVTIRRRPRAGDDHEPRPHHFSNFLPEPPGRLQSRAARGYGVPSFRWKALTPSGPAFNSRSMSGYVTSSPAVRSPITRKMASFCVRFRK